MGSQPFLRLYAHVDANCPEGKDFVRTVNAATVVPNALQRIMPIDADRGVFMVAYCDNTDAMSLRPWIRDTPATRREIGRLVTQGLDKGKAWDDRPLPIKHIRGFFWSEGTHFFRPLAPQFRDRDHFLQYMLSPLPGLVILGEGFSRHQGWTEGALEMSLNVERREMSLNDVRYVLNRQFIRCEQTKLYNGQDGTHGGREKITCPRDLDTQCQAVVCAEDGDGN